MTSWKHDETLDPAGTTRLTRSCGIGECSGMSRFLRVRRTLQMPAPRPLRPGGEQFGGIAMYRMLRIGATVMGLLAVFVIAQPAHAAENVPFTITENIDFEAEVFTFEATEPLCPLGTFEDDVAVAAFAHSEQARSGGFNLLIRATFTCDDGSGTFDMLKHVFITFAEDGSSTSTGPVQIVGGTGDYEGIIGHGVDVGAASAEGIGEGHITGFVVLAA
jgi:hypothetical protein